MRLHIHKPKGEAPKQKSVAKETPELKKEVEEEVEDKQEASAKDQWAAISEHTVQEGQVEEEEEESYDVASDAQEEGEEDLPTTGDFS